MVKYAFKSVLKEELYNFINFKRSCGYKYENAIYQCKKIDNYWYQLNLDKIVFGENIVLEYAKRKDNESINYLKDRLYILNHFSLFLVKQGYENIYVYDYPIKQNKYQYTPYIYTEEDFITFINGINNSKIYKKEMYITIFKLLYCTGLRLSEATHIKYKDINLDNKTIKITNGKNCNIRLIGLSNSIVTTLTLYLNNRFKTDDDYIFTTKNNDYIKNSQLQQIFRKINDKCKIGINAINSPRIHDFRHGFAIKTLDNMYEKGYDYYTILPILCKYMGHADITHTEYYLRLTKYYHYKVINKEISYNGHIIPEVSYDK